MKEKQIAKCIYCGERADGSIKQGCVFLSEPKDVQHIPFERLRDTVAELFTENAALRSRVAELERELSETEFFVIVGRNKPVTYLGCSGNVSIFSDNAAATGGTKKPKHK